MGTYLLRRIVSTIPVLLFLSAAAFLLSALLPGDAVSAMLAASEGMSPEVAAALRKQFGLDQPLPVRYLRWLGGLLTGDLGYSLHSSRSVISMISDRLPVTIILTGGAIGLALIIGVPLGFLAGVRPNSWLDRGLSVVAALGVSAPNFWLGILLVILFAQNLRWLPSFGYRDPLQHGFIAMLTYMILPWFTLSTARIVEVVRQVRSGTIEIMGLDFIRTARAKGLREQAVVWRHALRNVLIPVVTVTGLSVGRLLSGAVVTEQIFLLPGMGQLAINGVLHRDFPVVQGVVLVAGVATVAANLLADIAYGLLDPRIRYD